MDTALMLQLPGVVKFLVYFLATIVFTSFFALVYSRLTPYREFHLIAGGNVAAAYSMSGALLGFVLPLASAIIHSVGFLDMLLWGFIALVIQLLTYVAVSRLFKNLAGAIQEGCAARGLFLGALSLLAGVLNAACMSY